MLKKFKEFTGRFWLLNLFQMLEMFAYQIVVLQMSIYISQDDAAGGLHWEHTVKGQIFFFWALAQRLTPLFFGSFADKRGYKLTLLISYIFIISGYWVLGTQREFLPFLLGAVILGLGSGMFKPAVQGAIAHTLKPNSSSLSWGTYTLLLNIAVFIAIPVSKYLRISGWDFLFLGSATVILINFFLTLFSYEEPIGEQQSVIENPLRFSLKNLFMPKVFIFILIMSGFTTIYMQFYETLPNFIYDWVDTSDIITILKLPEFVQMVTPLGKMVSYEWLYGLNTILIILFVSFTSFIFVKYKSTNAIFYGILLSTAGLMLCGSSKVGVLFLFGIIVYTFGEMLTNPHFLTFLSEMSGENNKATLLSFLNISFAIGLSGGAFLGGYLYEHFGDKSNLAIKYLLENHNIIIDNKFAVEKLKEVLYLSDMQVRDFLWDYYQPYEIWYVFLGIGIITLISLYAYKKKYERV